MGSPAVEIEKSEQVGVPNETDRQRRKRERYGFPVVQKICPCRGKFVPGSARFFPVQCKDLSRGGIAFYLDYEPSFERFILMLGTDERHEYVAGEVVYVQALPDDAPGRYLVGCRLIKKVQSRAHADDEE